MKKTLSFILLLSIIIFNANAQKEKLKSRGGTAIVEYWKNDSVWVATDSKETDENGKFLANVQKIRKTRDVYYSTAGTFALGDYNKKNNSYSYFDPNNYIINAVKKTENLNDIVTSINKIIIPKLDTFYIANFIANKLKFSHDVVDSSVLEIVYTRFINGHPTILFTFYSLEGNSSNFKIKCYSANYTTSKVPYTVSGVSANIYKILDADKYYFNRSGKMKDKLNKLIEVAIKEDPIRVGLPINLYLITNKGWNKIE